MALEGSLELDMLFGWVVVVNCSEHQLEITRLPTLERLEYYSLVGCGGEEEERVRRRNVD